MERATRPVRRRPAPRVGQSRIIAEWREYQLTMNIPGPEEDRRFASELELREYEWGLRNMALHGDYLSRREAWRTIARSGNWEKISSITQETGKVPMSWLSDLYHLYLPSQVKELVVYNSLSRLDSPEVANYIEKIPISTESVLEQVRMNPESVNLPLEDVLAYTVSVVENENITVTSLLSEEELSNLAPLYGVSREIPGELMKRMTLQTRNDSSDPLHFFNAKWVGRTAPWLILNSTSDLQLAFFQQWNCYDLLLLYGEENEKKWLLERVDPVRQKLSTYYPRT